MSKSRSLLIAMICSLAGVPTIAHAQNSDTPKADPQDFVHDVLQALLKPNWNVFAHTGYATNDRFLLQQAINPNDGQRALESSNGFNVGAGAGVDILLRMGFRMAYTFTSSDLNFRTNNGNGSTALNVNDVATLMTHTASFEVMRYMLPARSAITPYGTLGFQATLWALDQKSPLVTSSGAGTQLSMSPIFSFGMQFKVSDKWSGRVEASLASGHNPFTGNKSYQATGPTIDEPTSVARTDFRLAGVYHFSKPKLPSLNAPVANR